MKLHIKLLLGVAVLTPVFALGSVAAETGSDSSNSGTGTTTTTTTTQEDKTTTTSDDSTTDDKGGLQERVSKRKSELKTKLTEVQQKRLQNTCKPAQAKAGTVNQKAQSLGKTRDQLYGKMTTRLNDLVTKLKAKNVDTTELEAEIKQLQTLVTSFDTDVATYKQAVSDLVSIDCATDPTGFQASLDAARTAREKVLTDSTGIRTYVNDTIKPTLQKIRSTLEKDETSDDKSTDDKTTTTTGGTN